MVTRYHGPGNLSKIINQLPVKFVGGSWCLDFVNTVGGRDHRGAVIRDKLGGYEDLLAWSILAGSLERRRAHALARLAGQKPRAAAAVMNRGIELREALHGLLKSKVEGQAPDAASLNIVRAEISQAQAHRELVLQDNGYAWVFTESPPALDRPLWPVARSAADLLTSAELARVRQCAGPECGWMFLDTSRNHRRQWCDMRDCGNRAKVRRWRESRRG